MLNAKRILINSSSRYSIFGYLKGNYFKYTTQTTEEVNLSNSCIKRLQELEKSNKFLRISVESGGCSGFEYKFNLDTNIDSQDCVIKKDNCKVVIDKESLSFLKGATIDYYEELIRSGFRIINNPVADHGCSCGSSFSIKL